MSATAAFFVGLIVGALGGVLGMAMAIVAGRADQRLDTMYQQPDRRSEPRLIKDPRLGYRHQLEELRRGYDREHPEGKDGSTW